MIEIIKNKEKWDLLVNNADMSDFYHTYDYHQLSKNNDETPVLLYFSQGEKYIALPLFIREIENTSYKDATSVYGYSGPVCKNIPKNFDNSIFKKELQKLLLDNNIISMFSRLNPFIDKQCIILKNIGLVRALGNVVYIDLSQDLAIQKQQYNRRLKTHINKTRKHCTIKKATTTEEIDQFIEVYYENMHRVDAKKHYFFKREYFHDLYNSDSFETEILLTYHTESNIFIGGAMFIKKNNITQYHLAGAKSDYLYLNPIKLLIDEMRITSSEENYTFLNLGGGLGSNEDSLFRFKSSFSKNLKPFELWEVIVNKEVYDKLSKKNKTTNTCTSIEYINGCKDFFPCYRCTIEKKDN
ncbi:MAG: GNAT family N-acetyltransferase [Cellulophaga sp.]